MWRMKLALRRADSMYVLCMLAMRKQSKCAQTAMSVFEDGDEGKPRV